MQSFRMLDVASGLSLFLGEVYGLRASQKDDAEESLAETAGVASRI